MNIEQIRQLIELMKENELTELRISDGQGRIILRRGGKETQLVAVPAAQPMPQVIQAAPLATAAGSPAAAEATQEQVQQEQDQAASIKSPMVGTFYTAADPESPPLAKVGDHVEADTVVCIIEAMKVFNEIKAEASGTIEKVLIKNEQPVEFGQPMFLIKPD